MSLEFSGHTTRSGRGRRPAATSAASVAVARTWLSSTARRCALKSRPSRGTLPCTMATVTAAVAGVPRPARSRPATSATRRTASQAAQRHQAAGRRPAPPASATSAPTGGRHRERHQRRAAERRRAAARRVALAERQPPPREAAERRPVPQRLLRHPQQPRASGGHSARHRSHQRRQPRARRAEQGQVHRPGRWTAAAHGSQPAAMSRPVQQRHEEHQPGDHADAGAGRAAAAGAWPPPAGPPPTGASHHSPYGGNAASSVRPAATASSTPPTAAAAPAGRRRRAVDPPCGRGGAASSPPAEGYPARVTESTTPPVDLGVVVGTRAGADPATWTGIGARPGRPRPDAPWALCPAGAVRRRPGRLRTDPARGWLPRRAVVYWPPVFLPGPPPEAATGPRRPADPHPLDLACARPLRGLRPVSEGTKRTQPLPVLRTLRRYVRPPAACQLAVPAAGRVACFRRVIRRLSCRRTACSPGRSPRAG